MKLITLNIWGGKIYDPLMLFLTEYANEIDIFCFQEVFHSSKKRILAKEMHSDMYAQVSAVLKDFQGFYAPHLKKHDLDTRVDFDLEWGLATFVRKSIPVIDHGDIFIYRKGFDLFDNNYQTIPRNLQYIKFQLNKEEYIVSHFHGIWYPRTKTDTEDRIVQSNKIKTFLDEYGGKKILCGDFNILPNTKSMSILEEGMRNVITDSDITSTRSSIHERTEKYSDYMLISPNVTVKKFDTIDSTVSDHLPLYLEFI